MFEQYLQNIHAKDYHGTDDDMPDAFEAWVSELGADEFLDYGNKAMEEAHEQGCSKGYTQGKEDGINGGPIY